VADNEVKVTISGDDSQLTKTIKNSSKEIANFSTETASKVKAGFDEAAKAPGVLDGAVNTSHGKIITALGSIGSKAASVGGEVGSKLAGGFEGAAAGIEHMVGGAVKNLSKITVAAGAVAAGLGTAFGVSAVKTFGDFEQAINEGAAATDNFGGKRKEVEDLAISLGRDLPVSATDAAQGMVELGKAGFDANEILAAGPGVARLSVAAHISIGKAAEITTGAIRGFGLAASDTNMVLDIMTATANASSVDVTDMKETFKYAGSAAHAAGYSIQDLSIATGIMGNSMIKGSDAGTALRSIITRLAAPPKEAAGAFDKLGISAFTADGKSKPFRDTLVDLRAKFAGLSQQEQIDMGKKIAGQEALGGFLSLMNASTEDFNKMRDAVDGSAGSLDKMVNVMNSGTKMGIENLKGSIEALQIRIGQHLAPAVNFLSGKLADFVNIATAKVEPAFAKLSAIFSKVEGTVALIASGFTGKLIPAALNSSSMADVVHNKFFKIGETLAILGTRINAFITQARPLVTQFFSIASALSPVMTAFEVFKGFLNGGMSEAINVFKMRLIGMVAVFGFDLPSATRIVGNIFTTIGNIVTNFLIPSFNAVVSFIQGTVIPTFNNISAFITSTLIPAFQAFGNWLTSNIGPIFGAIVNTIQNTVLPSLGKLGEFIVTQVVPKLGQLFEWIGQKVVPVFEKLAAFIADPVIPVMGKIAAFVMEHVVPALAKIVEIIATVLAPILEKLADIFTTYVLPALTKVANFIGENVLPVLAILYDFFSNNIAPVLRTVADIIGNSLSKVLGEMFALWGKIADILIGAVKVAMEGIKGAINFVIDAVNLLIEGVNLLGGAFGVHIDKLGKVGEAQNTVKQSTQDLANGYNTATSAVASTVKSLDDVVAKAQGTVGPMTEAGRAAGEGFANGITGSIGAAASAAARLGAASIAATRNAIEARSPSRITTEIGQNFGEGFSLGIVSKIGESVKAVKDLTGGVISAAKDIFGGIKSDVGGAGAGLAAGATTASNVISEFIANMRTVVEGFANAGNEFGTDMIAAAMRFVEPASKVGSAISSMASGLGEISKDAYISQRVMDSFIANMRIVTMAFARAGDEFGKDLMDAALRFAAVASPVGKAIADMANGLGKIDDAVAKSAEFDTKAHTFANNLQDGAGAIAAGVAAIAALGGGASDPAYDHKTSGANSNPGTTPTVPAYAIGTMFHPGGAALVHAGELIQPPSGNAIYASADTFFTNLAKGSKVFTANQTEGMTQSGGGSQSIGNVTININGTGLDPKAIANEVSKQLNAQGQSTVLAKVARAA